MDSNNKYPRFMMKRPSRETLDSEIDTVNKEISTLDEQVKKCKTEMDNISKAKNGSRAEVDAAKNRLNSVVAEKRAHLAERSQLVTLRDQVKISLEANKTAEKNLKAQLRYSNVEELNSAIRELEKKQMTTSMGLQEEKRLLTDIKNLKAMKGNFSTIEEIKKLIESDKDRRDDFDKKITQMSKVIDAATAKVNEAQAALDAITKTNASKGDALPQLRNQQTELRAAIAEKYATINSLRDNFKKSENEYFEALKEFKEKERVRREQEAAARKEKYEQEKKEREAAELARIPYEDEMKLCDFLVNYLTLQLPNSGAASAAASSPAVSVGPALVPRAANAPEGLVALNRDSHVDMWAPPKKQKDASKPKDSKATKDVAAEKKKKGSDASNPVRHDLNSIAMFNQIGVTAPMNIAGINAAIDELKAKKTMYSTAERGALPSMYDARKAKEDEKYRQREEKSATAAATEGEANADGADAGASKAKKERKQGRSKKADDSKGSGEAPAADAEGDAGKPSEQKKDKKPRNNKEKKPRPATAPAGEGAAASVGDEKVVATSTDAEGATKQPKKPRNNRNGKKEGKGSTDNNSKEGAPINNSESEQASAAVINEVVTAAVNSSSSNNSSAVDAGNDTDAPPGL